MSLLTISVSAGKKLKGICSKFLWGDSERRRRYHLVALRRNQEASIFWWFKVTILGGDEWSLPSQVSVEVYGKRR